MNDKERILTLILSQLYTTQTLCLGGERESQFYNNKYGIDEYAHFGAYDDRPVEKGDLVLALTGNINDWKIAWVHEVVSFDTCILREIGSNRLCRYGNEKFVRIVGINPRFLLEGDEYLFEQKVLKAFQRKYEYMYRYGGIDFLDNKKARIWIREAFGGFPPGSSKPFSFIMKWNKRTSIKSILNNMIENGYGTRKFDKVEITNEKSI